VGDSILSDVMQEPIPLVVHWWCISAGTKWVNGFVLSGLMQEPIPSVVHW